MNETYFMGLKLQSNLPKHILEMLMNLAIKDSKINEQLALWHGVELKRHGVS